MRYPAILAAAALGAATALAAPAAAASDESQASVGVKYSDLDLSTRAGQAALERRIHSAARSVCGMDRVPTGSHMPSLAARRCYDETKTRVHAQVAETIARSAGRG
jgi:UrcA family protein